MLSPTEQYRAQNIEITTGYESDLTKVPVPKYTEEQHGTWALMHEAQQKQLPTMAAPEFLQGLKVLNLPKDRIPALKDVSKRLEDATGWKIARVGGLVPEKEFLNVYLKNFFPSTDFIRQRSELNYTPSPDMFHDLFGHCPMITDPNFANFYEYFGRAALRANKNQLAQLQRIYWFSVEFGLVETPKGIRIYGSGILSSMGEVPNCLGDDVRRHAFSYDKVTAQDYEIFHMQEDLFVIPSLEWLLESFKSWAKKEKLVS